MRKIWWKIGENDFETSLILILLSLLLGGLILYVYGYRPAMQRIDLDEEVEEFNKEIFFDVLSYWEETESGFPNNEESFPNPFGRGDLTEEDIGEGPGEVLEKDETGDEEGEAESDEMISYVIEPGDNLWVLAEEYLGSGFRWVEIVDDQGESFSDWRAEVLKVGEEVFIPATEE